GSIVTQMDTPRLLVLRAGKCLPLVPSGRRHQAAPASERFPKCGRAVHRLRPGVDSRVFELWFLGPERQQSPAGMRHFEFAIGSASNDRDALRGRNVVTRLHVTNLISDGAAEQLLELLDRKLCKIVTAAHGKRLSHHRIASCRTT